MLNSGIIDLAIGIVFIFGVTAALCSVLTELIARFLGLRGTYLLIGLHELLDGDNAETDLTRAIADYSSVKSIMPRRVLVTVGAETPPAPAVTVTPDLAIVPAAPVAWPGPQSATGVLLGSPILRSQGMTGLIDNRLLIVRASRIGHPEVRSGTGKRDLADRRSLPSYIPARSFSEAVIALFAPDEAGQRTMIAVQDGISLLPESMITFKLSLEALAANAGNDITTFRTSIEDWYDDHMDRVSGWYKRHVAKITIVVGAILVLLFNINTITIGRALYSSSAVSSAVSTAAANHPPCTTADRACLGQLQADLSAVAQADLPIGWATVSACADTHPACNWWQARGILSPTGGSTWQIVVVIFGFLITIIALTPGARFLFDLLGKLGSTLSSAGPKPTSPSS
jgi:hypothetical protein